MCTAYELGKRGGSFPERATAMALDELMEMRGTRLIRPTLQAPVMMPDGSLESMSWGFRREFAGKAKGRKITRTIVNSREDKLGGKTWSAAFQQRRCIIPAAAFYEWIEVAGRNVPLRFEDPDGGWLWIAGIWEEAAEGRCFSMITTEPNELMVKVHDRMPAVLGAAAISPYLDGELHAFGPSGEALSYVEAENFLTAKKPAVQGELF